MRTALRSFAVMLLAVAVVTCVDSPVGPTSGAASSHGRASLAFAPRFSSSAVEAAVVYDLNGLLVNEVEVVVTLNGQTLADTTVAYSALDSNFSLALNVAADPGDQVSFTLQYLSGSTVLYSGSGTTTAVAVGAPAPANPTPVVIVPVGPGATASRVAITPSGGSFPATASILFAAQVLDANSNPIAGALLSWSVSDPTIATIGATSGLLQPTGKRGTVTVSAATLNGVAGQATVSLIPPPAKLVLVSGGGQSGVAGSTLPQPVVVQLQATDGIGVSGQPVTFGITPGSVTPTTATTDANGNAQTTVTLGTTSGLYTLTATSLGFSATATETANATTVSSLVLVSGSGQTDSIKQQLPAPLVVKALDQFGNPKSGVTVTWARTAGSGTPSASVTTTGSDGTTSITYTFGSATGTETVTASTAGVSTPVTFSETATSAGAATITAVSGGGQQVAISVPFLAPLVVRVVDAGGNPVAGAPVTWTISGGTFASSQTATDATGQATATIVAGRTVGSLVATATLANGASVQFNELVDPGAPTTVRFTVGPSNSLSGGTISPAVQVTVLDAGGNLLTLAPASVTVSLTGGTPGATLSGTLTQKTVAGVATFSDLSVGTAGTGYQLVATVGTVTGTSGGFNVTIGVAAKMVLFGQSSYALVAGATLPSGGIQVTDAGGNGVPGVAITLNPDSSGVSQGTYSTTTDAGGFVTIPELLAVFSPNNHAVATGTGNYSVTFSNAALQGSPITITVTVSAGPASQIQFISIPPPGQGTAGSPLPAVTVGVTDQFGNVVTSAIGSVTVSLNSGPANDTLSGTLTASLVSGVATFSNLILNKTSGSYTLKATSGSFPSVVSNQFGIFPGAAASLVIGTVPSSVAAGSSIGNGNGVRVTVLDAKGNQATSSIAVTMAITGGAVGAVLSGSSNPPTLQTSNGTVTFSILSINLPGTGYHLIASAPGLPPDTSAIAFTVTGGLATKVRFTVQPSNTQAGVVSSPAIQATLYDANNNIATTATNTITLTIKTGTGGTGANVSNGAVNPTNGVSTFSNLTINVAGTNYQLVANGSGTGISADTSIAFNVTPGPEHRLVFFTEPSFTESVGVAFSPAPVVKIEDSLGNVITTSTDSVTLVLNNNPASATLSGAGARAVNGIATFPNVTINKAGTGFSMEAMSPNAPISAVSNTFNVNYPGVLLPSAITASNGNAFVAVAGSSVTYTLTLRDSVPPSPGFAVVGASWTWSMKGQAGVLFSPSAVDTTNGSGTVSVTATFPSGAASIDTLVATLSTGQFTDSYAGIIVSLPASKLGFVTSPPASATNSVVLGTQPVVELLNSSNQVIATAGDTVKASISPAGATLSGTTSEVTDGTGKATFTNLKITGAVGSYTLTFASTGLTSATSAITLQVGPAQKVVYDPEPAGDTLNFESGSGTEPSGPLYEVVDSSGNPIPNYAITFQYTPQGFGTAYTTISSNSNGTISLAAFGVFGVGKYNIQVNDDPSGQILAGNGDFPNALNITVTGPPYEIASTGSPGSVSYGASFTLVYEFLDNSGIRVVSGAPPTTVTLTYTCATCNPVGGSINGTLSVNTVNGIATFSGLSSTLPGGDGGTYTFTASSAGLLSPSQVQVQVFPTEQARVPDRTSLNEVPDPVSAPAPAKSKQ